MVGMSFKQLMESLHRDPKLIPKYAEIKDGVAVYAFGVSVDWDGNVFLSSIMKMEDEAAKSYTAYLKKCLEKRYNVCEI